MYCKKYKDKRKLYVVREGRTLKKYVMDLTISNEKRKSAMDRFGKG